MENFKNIPSELAASGRFCVWKLEADQKGRMTKIPYNPRTGGKAQSNNPDTFTDFETVLTYLQSGQYSGIGLGIFGNVCAIDIDDCVINGVLSEMAQDIIGIMNAYTEYSPSGNGIRILFTVTDFAYDKAVYYINNQELGLEVYVAGATKKYVTVTGNVISAGKYGDRTTKLQIVLDKYMKRRQGTKAQPAEVQPRAVQPVQHLSDIELLEKARAAKNGAKFNALYSGDISGYPSHSEADLALCSILAFWCGCNAEQIDRLFRGSGLYREKWDRPQAGSTYGRGVINTAIQGCTDVYNPIPKHSSNSKPSTETLKPADYTDIGQARILSREYSDTLRFSRATNWLLYNGKAWTEAEVKAHGLAQDLTDMQLAEALKELRQTQENARQVAASGDTKMKYAAKRALIKATEYRDFVLTRRNSGKISAAQKEAQPMLEIEVDVLDADPFKLNTPSGTVDLRTGELLPHNPNDYCTKITAASPTDEGVELFADFLKVITCGDKELVAYLQLIGGMCAVGKVFCENLVIAYGSGRNGKSTIFNLLARVMGDYSGSLSAETLTANCRKNKSPEYAELRGKRLVISAELDEGMRLDTAIVKKLCSTDPILAEKKYKDPFSFTPSHTVILYTNHLPKVGTSDTGTWRRLIVIPFNAVIEESSDIKNYADYLFQHAAGAVLAWIVEGARKFIAAEYQIDPPQCVKQAIASYRQDNDSVGDYIFERCAVDKTYIQESGKLYEDYREYCKRMGDYPRKMPDFKNALECLGYKWNRTKRGGFFYGLRLMTLDKANPPVDPLQYYVEPPDDRYAPPMATVTDGDDEITNISDDDIIF